MFAVGANSSVKRDRIFNNLGGENSFSLPVYPSLPPIKPGGFLIYNSSDGSVYKSNGRQWIILSSGGTLTPSLISLGALPINIDDMVYGIGPSTWATTKITSQGRNLVAASNQNAAQSVLGLIPGTNIQPFNNALSTFGAVSNGASNNQLIYSTGAGVFGITNFTPQARQLLDDPTSAAMRITLGLSDMATKTPTPVGDVVGLSDIQILTNKNLTSTTNDIRATRIGDTAGTYSVTFVTGTGAPGVGDILVADGFGNASWAADSGDVVGPATSTDNAIVKWNGTSGNLIQNSGVILDDSNNISGINTLTSTSLAGLLTTAAQSNITSLGTLSSLGVSGNSNFNTVTTTGLVNLNAGATVPAGQVLTLTNAPTSGTDAANKSYVDSVAAVGLTPLAAGQAATTAILPNTPTYNSAANTLTATGAVTALTIDGIVITALSGQRILVKNQVDPRQNGVYIRIANSGGNWVLQRSTDFNTPTISKDTFIFIETGTTNQNSGWLLIKDVTQFNPPLATPGNSDVLWTQFSGSSPLNAGTGMTQTGNTFNVNGTPGRISVDATSVNIDSGYVGQNSINTLGTVTTGTWNANDITPANGGTGLSSPAAGNILVTAGAGNMTLKTNPTGAFAGTTDAQVLTNKTLVDSTTTVQDNADNTKQFQFQASGITTGNTRIYGVPDSNTTLIGDNTTNTLTNKTINSSSNTVDLNGATFDGVTFNAAGGAPGANFVLSLDAGSANPAWRAPTPPTPTFPARTLVVAQSGGTHTTIAAAITGASSLTPTLANQILILVHPGTYNEANPLVVPSFVTIAGAQTSRTFLNDPVRVTPTTLTTSVFQLSNNSSIFNITVNGANSAGGIGFQFPDVATPNAVAQISNCDAINCQIGFQTVGRGKLDLFNCEVFADVTMSTSIGFNSIAGGDMRCSNCSVISRTTGPFIGTGFLCEGILAVPPASGSVIDGDSIFVQFCFVGLDSRGGGADPNESLIKVISGEILQSQGAGVIARSNAKVELFGVNVTTSADVFDVFLISASSKFLGVGNRIRTDRVNLAANSSFIGLGVSDQPGDTAISVKGELHVGAINIPSESAFGEGDSTTRGMGVFTANLTGPPATDDGTNFVSITASVILPDALTANAFASTAAGQLLYFSQTSFQKSFPGIKINVSTAIVPAFGFISGSQSIALEYWNGTAWTGVPFMSTDFGEPYITRANELFSTGEFQYRFGNTQGWVQKAVNGSNGFWIRFRLTAAITTIPVLNVINLHTNKTKINDNGFLEYFGKAQPKVRLPFDINWFVAANNSPANADVFIQDTLGVGRTENSFVDGVTDRAGFLTELPEDLDTSKPFTLLIRYRVSITGPGNIVFNIRWGYNVDIADDPSPVGNSISRVFVTAGLAPTTAAGFIGIINDVIPVAAGVQNRMLTRSINLDVSTLRPARNTGSNTGDVLWVSVERQGGNAADTYGGDLTLVQVTPFYIRWCEGAFNTI